MVAFRRFAAHCLSASALSEALLVAAPAAAALKQQQEPVLRRQSQPWRQPVVRLVPRPEVCLHRRRQVEPDLEGQRPDAVRLAQHPDRHVHGVQPRLSHDDEEGLWVGGQFHDGRAATLEEQAKQPFLNPSEMANANRAEVVAKLQAGANAAAFVAVYGPDAFADVDTAYDNIAAAIAAYERSDELNPFTSKYDYFLKGRARLSDAEMRGFQAFSDPMKGNCSACHISDVGPGGELPLFTDFTYDNIGIPKNFRSGFLTNPHNHAGEAFLDTGLGGIVGDSSPEGAFKVTTLRNIELTAPYGHNGWFTSLDQIVDFYATRDVKPVCISDRLTAEEASAIGCWPVGEFAANQNVDELGNLPLSQQDKDDIVAFLRTLTDGYQPVPESATWAMMIAGFGLVGEALRRAARTEAA